MQLKYGEELWTGFQVNLFQISRTPNLMFKTDSKYTLKRLQLKKLMLLVLKKEYVGPKVKIQRKLSQ